MRVAQSTETLFGIVFRGHAMKRLYFLTFMLLLGLSSPATTVAQSEQRLPSDLLFSVASEDSLSAPFDTLVRMDAQTLHNSTFFVDSSASIRALSWSPQARLLAILRNRHTDEVEICVIARSGQLQTCFEDTISQYALGELAQDYTVTWSTDEQRVSFIAEHSRILSLIEGDALTGKTRQIIYQLPQTYGEIPPHIHWTPSLDSVAIYQGRYPYISDYSELIEIRRVTLVDLQSGRETELNTHIPELGYLSFCEGFSPSGDYLVARVYIDEYLPDFIAANPILSALVVVGKGGRLVSTIDLGQLSQYELNWAHCPAWQAQEDSFYFLAGSWDNDPATVDKTSIFRYSLLSNELMELKRFGPETGPGFPSDPLIPSPDGTSIAFQFKDASAMSEIAVLLPGGEIVRFNEPYSRGAYPLWIPSLE
jgi:hypothetical protein